jgi:outer membrane protein OmpA-like peptidoglycan-associated protein
LDEYGCPLDTDSDDVPDYMDQCPNTPAEAYGKVDQYGCPIDSDEDGIVDYMDQCPNTPAVARNHVDEVGCTLDTDGDGVYDYEDLCPTIAGEKGTSGCPEVKKEVKTILTKAMQGIQFENGKATIKPTSYKILDQVAKVFIDNPTYIIEIQGHTDNVGNYQYNVDLSEKRAQSVRDYLIKHGVSAARMTAHGYGPDKPIADNNTKQGRTLNRRVEFKITFEETKYID